MGRKVRRREIKTNEKRAKKSKRAQILLHWAYVFLFCVFVFFCCCIAESVEKINIGKTSRAMKSVCPGNEFKAFAAAALRQLNWNERSAKWKSPVGIEGVTHRYSYSPKPIFHWLQASMIFHACDETLVVCISPGLFRFISAFFAQIEPSSVYFSSADSTARWPAEKRSRNINGSNNNKHSTPTIIGDL